jgi:DNA (cytosine-5)-methyltransferase 1
MKICGDNNKNYKNIPNFDVLCGGFPCQTFSKAGNQEGFENEEKGKLFFKIIEILKLHPECKFIILENVRNLADDSKFWNIIQEKLRDLNFFITIDPIIKSPDFFGIPQNRERVYILGIKKELRDKTKLLNGWIHTDDLKLEKFKKECVEGTAFRILNKIDSNNSIYCITPEEKAVINAWKDFKQTIIPDKQIGAPVWIDYFGFGYPENKSNEFFIKSGYFNQKKKVRKKDLLDTKIIVDKDGFFIEKTPEWKQKFIKKIEICI